MELCGSFTTLWTINPTPPCTLKSSLKQEMATHPFVFGPMPQMLLISRSTWSNLALSTVKVRTSTVSCLRLQTEPTLHSPVNLILDQRLTRHLLIQMLVTSVSHVMMLTFWDLRDPSGGHFLLAAKCTTTSVPVARLGAFQYELLSSWFPRWLLTNL